MPRRWLSPDFFTDEKMKKATVPERLLASAIIANQDDDGRLRGDPAYLRAIAFLYDDYSLEAVKEMRDHLAKVNPNILLYENSGEEYIQLKRYKRYQKPRYYHPSKMPPPPGWPFEEGNSEVVTEPQLSSTQVVTKQQPKRHRSVTTDKDRGKDLELDQNKGKGMGKGSKPKPPPSLTISPVKLFNKLVEAYKTQWGRVPAEAPDKIIPREPGARELAQLRDLADELMHAGGCQLDVIDQAFREAAGQQKFKVSYVRAILLDWLGIDRSHKERPP